MALRQSVRRKLTELEEERWRSRDRHIVEASVLSSKRLFLVDINRTLLYGDHVANEVRQRDGIPEFMSTYRGRDVTIALTTDSTKNVETNDGKRLDEYGRRHLERVLYWCMQPIEAHLRGDPVDPNPRDFFREGVESDFPWLTSIDFFFGKKWCLYFDSSIHDGALTCVKDYESMARVAEFSIDDCVVIGDRRSENTMVSGFDYVEVPSEGNYDFRQLIV